MADELQTPQIGESLADSENRPTIDFHTWMDQVTQEINRLRSNGGPGATTRNFNYFDGTDNNVSFTQSFVATATSTIRGRVMVDQNNSVNFLLDGTSNTATRFFMAIGPALPGGISIQSGTVSVDGGAGVVADLSDGELHTFEVTGITAGREIAVVGSRFNGVSFHRGFILDLELLNFTVGGGTAASYTYSLNDTGTSAEETNGAGPSGTYNNFGTTQRHVYTLNDTGTQWNQNDPTNPNLPNPIVIA